MQEGHELSLPRFEVNQNVARNAVVISVNLTNVVRAFLLHKNNRQDLAAEQQFNSMLSHLRNEFKKTCTPEAINNYFHLLFSDLSLHQINTIIDTFPSQDLIKVFDEVYKNVIDEIIESRASHNDYRNVTASLELTFELTENQIKFHLTDLSGRGFPPEFLEKVSTSEAQQAYVSERRISSKKYLYYPLTDVSLEELILLKTMLPQYVLPSSETISELSLDMLDYRNILFRKPQIDLLIRELEISVDEIKVRIELLQRFLAHITPNVDMLDIYEDLLHVSTMLVAIQQLIAKFESPVKLRCILGGRNMGIPQMIEFIKNNKLLGEDLNFQSGRPLYVKCPKRDDQTTVEFSNASYGGARITIAGSYQSYSKTANTALTPPTPGFVPNFNLADIYRKKGYYLKLMSRSQFDKQIEKLDLPTLVKLSEGTYQLWGYKENKWQLSEVKLDQNLLNKIIEDSDFTNQKTINIVFDSPIFNALKESHTQRNDELIQEIEEKRSFNVEGLLLEDDFALSFEEPYELEKNDNLEVLHLECISPTSPLSFFQSNGKPPINSTTAHLKLLDPLGLNTTASSGCSTPARTPNSDKSEQDRPSQLSNSSLINLMFRKTAADKSPSVLTSSKANYMSRNNSNSY